MRAFTAVLIMALVTYIPRALPVTLFRKEIKSRFIRSFLYYVPYSVLACLTFPDILYSTGNMKAAAIGTLAALILAIKEKSLVIVALAAMSAVYISGLFL